MTSHGAGMAVPDWPNTYGYNMFFFPLSQWVGGIFYEHYASPGRFGRRPADGRARLVALWAERPAVHALGRRGACCCSEPRQRRQCRADGRMGWSWGSPAWRCWARAWFGRAASRAPNGCRRLGLAAFVAVVLQGVLGGLRVVLFKDAIGIFHATLAQLFFVLALRHRPLHQPLVAERTHGGTMPSVTTPAHNLSILLTTLAHPVQLVLGATMRHQHAGLAIPDFPLAYGKLWPAMDAASVAGYNQQRIEVVAANPITAFQIGLQMIHRVRAFAILGAVLCRVVHPARARRKASFEPAGPGLAGRNPGASVFWARRLSGRAKPPTLPPRTCWSARSRWGLARS